MLKKYDIPFVRLPISSWNNNVYKVFDENQLYYLKKLSDLVNYAYDNEMGKATIQVEVNKEPLSVVITFIDQGKPYDPLAKPDPDITLSALERPIGGLGIFMVKKSMDNVKYEYKDGSNILTIEKNL